MDIRFGGMSYYSGPSASIDRELKAKKPDQAVSLKLLRDKEGLYLSGQDLANCAQQKFQLTDVQALLARFSTPQAKNALKLCFDYYREAKARNHGRDAYQKPIEQVVYQETLYGKPKRLTNAP
jgi:type VI protein secretion system component VasK